MEQTFKFSKVCRPDTFDVHGEVFRCASHVDAKKAEELLNELMSEIDQLKLQLQAYERGAQSKSQVRRMVIQIDTEKDKRIKELEKKLRGE